MNFSYYEIYITSLRAFNGMGFPFGADEDAAFMTTWLELYRFQGIKKLAKLSKKIDKKFDAKIDLEKIKSSSLINIDHSSLLMKGPGLFDYLYEETKNIQHLEVTLENCIDPIFIISFSLSLSVLNFVFLFTFSYICAACLFNVASGIILSCFLSVIGAVEHAEIINPQLQQPNIPRNSLLFMLLISPIKLMV